MVQSARIDDFIAAINEKKVQFALITPTSSFIGTHLAEALLAQNIAVLCEVTNNSQVAAYTKHLQTNPLFFITDHTHQHAIPLNLPAPKYIIYDVDESFHHFSATDNISFTISLETKRLLEYATTNKSRFILLSQIEDTAFDPFAPPKPFDPSPSTNTKQHEEQLKRFVETLVVESIEKSPLDGQIIHYAQVYGARMDLDSPSFPAESIKHAVNNEAVTITGDGLQNLYPLYVSDFIYGVIKTLFVPKGATVYTLNHPEAVTQLSFATALQKVAQKFSRNVAIEFQTSPEHAHLFVSHDHQKETETLAWQPKITLTEGIERTLAFFVPPLVKPPTQAPLVDTAESKAAMAPAIPVVAPAASKTVSFLSQAGKETAAKVKLLPKPHIHAPHLKPSLPLTIGLLVSGFILVMIGILAPAIVFDYLAQRITVASIKVQTDKPSLEALRSQIQTAQTIGRYATLANRVLHRTSQQETTTTNFRILNYRVTAQLLANEATNTIASIFTTAGSTFGQIEDNTASQLEQATTDMLLAQALAKTLPANRLLSSPSLDQNQTATSIKQAITANQLVTLLYQNNKERTLAVLFIDNTKLRPGGGVISGGVAVTTKPKTPTQGTSFDPTTIAIPPTNAKQKGQLSLSESLATPDVSTNLSQFLVPIQSVVKKPIDAIITIDVPALQALLAITGPITVGDSIADSKSIASFVSTTSFSQNPTLVFNELLQKVSQKTFANPFLLSELKDWLNQQTQNQDVVVILPDLSLKQFSQSRGSILPVLPSDNFIGVFDTVVNTTANPAPTKTIHHDIVIDKKFQVNERVIITYTPSAAATPGARPTAQMVSQLALPKDRKVTRVTVDKKPVKVSEEPFDGGKAVSVTLSQSSPTEVVIEYQRVLPLTFTNNQTLLETSLLKQNGTGQIPYELAISYPTTLQATAQGFDQFIDGILFKGFVDNTKTMQITVAR